jgi:hypothetical protein
MPLLLINATCTLDSRHRTDSSAPPPAGSPALPPARPPRLLLEGTRTAARRATTAPPAGRARRRLEAPCINAWMAAWRTLASPGSPSNRRNQVPSHFRYFFQAHSCIGYWSRHGHVTATIRKHTESAPASFFSRGLPSTCATVLLPRLLYPSMAELAH